MCDSFCLMLVMENPSLDKDAKECQKEDVMDIIFTTLEKAKLYQDKEMDSYAASFKEI